MPARKAVRIGLLYTCLVCLVYIVGIASREWNSCERSVGAFSFACWRQGATDYETEAGGQGHKQIQARLRTEFGCPPL